MGYRAELERKAVEILAQRDRVGDRAFSEGREPTAAEWLRMEALNNEYQDIINFLNSFRPAAPEPCLAAHQFRLH